MRGNGPPIGGQGFGQGAANALGGSGNQNGFCVIIAHGAGLAVFEAGLYRFLTAIGQGWLESNCNGVHVMTANRPENHEVSSPPRHLLVKLAAGLVAMFALFYLTGMWAVSTQ